MGSSSQFSFPHSSHSWMLRTTRSYTCRVLHHTLSSLRRMNILHFAKNRQSLHSDLDEILLHSDKQRLCQNTNTHVTTATKNAHHEGKVNYISSARHSIKEPVVSSSQVWSSVSLHRFAFGIVTSRNITLPSGDYVACTLQGNSPQHHKTTSISAHNLTRNLTIPLTQHSLTFRFNINLHNQLLPPILLQLLHLPYHTSIVIIS